MVLSGAAAGVSAPDLTAAAQYRFASNEHQPDFPRLVIIAVAYDQTYPPANRPTFAKFHVVIIGGNWDTWDNASAYSREDVVRGIKAQSRVGTEVFQYVDYNYVDPTGSAYDLGDPNNCFEPETNDDQDITDDITLAERDRIILLRCNNRSLALKRRPLLSPGWISGEKYLPLSMIPTREVAPLERVENT
jgi:hypothetical protein